MSLSWKEKVAQFVEIPLIMDLMRWGISLMVPKRRVGVAVIALDENERVLMLRHVFHPRVPWGLPGGWLNRNEHPERGALRELKEETGLDAKIKYPVLISMSKIFSSINIVYRVSLLPGNINLSSEIIEADWFAVDELPSPLSKTVSRAIALTFSSGLENPASTTANAVKLIEET